MEISFSGLVRICLYGLLCILIIAIYAFYHYILRPYLRLKYYRRFPQVYVNPKFHPIQGDFVEYHRCIEEGKTASYYIKEISINNPKKKYHVVTDGYSTSLLISDPEVMEELNRLIPSHFDRDPKDTACFSKLKGSIGDIPSNENWKKRRMSLIKSIGMNYASRFIPILLQEC